MGRLRYVSTVEVEYLSLTGKCWVCKFFLFLFFFFFPLPCIFKRKKEKVPAIKGICQEQPPASTTNEQLQCVKTLSKF